MARWFHSGAVAKSGNGPNLTLGPSVRFGRRRRTLFSIRYSLQDTHIDECFMNVSITVLIGVFGEGCGGQGRGLDTAPIPEDLFPAMQASDVPSHRFLRNQR